jgi:ABC-type cobalt transport system substrate-binding protein
MITTKEIIKLFDTKYEMLQNLYPNTKDYTLLIESINLLIKQMKITRNVSIQLKKDNKYLSDDEFTEEAIKIIEKKLEPIIKRINELDSLGVIKKLFSLPNKKGKEYYEIMYQLEEAGKLKLNDPNKRIIIDNLILSLENFRDDIEKLNKPFISSKINKNKTLILKFYFKNRKKTWWKIEIKETDTLEDLHYIIQEALNWGDDHLYSFFMDNKTNNGDPDMEYTIPYEPDGRKTVDKTKIGIFGLKLGQKFAYLFDFGDCHEFEIEVIGFGDINKNKKYPLIIESKGKAPEQYPDYE